MARLLVLLFFLPLLYSCSSPTVEDYREEGQGIMLSLLKEIRGIHTRQELAARLPKLQRLFDALADVIIAAHRCRLQHNLLDPLSPIDAESILLNDKLRAELTRLYSIPGARDMVEKAQQETLYRLDKHLQSSKKLKP